MSQGLRDMLANRRFAIPLIVLLAFCFIGLILIGIVLIWQPGAPDRGEPVAQETASATAEPTDLATFTPTATSTSTPRPSPTLVVLDTPGAGTPGAETPDEETPGAETPGVEEPLSTAEVGETQVAAEQTMTADAGQTGSSADQTATAEAASGEEPTAAPTDTATVDDEELAQTGVGWGLILFSGVGLGLLAIAARRLRMANP